MIEILVVDDEPLARRRLLRLLGQLDGYRLAGEAENGVEAVAACRALQPDIVLMDIRMPGMDGLEACRHIMAEEKPPAIIFCTAYDDYALAAFESQAIGYLLKPPRLDSLEVALRRAQRLNRSQLAQLREEGAGQREHLSARTRSGVELVPVSEVRLLQAEQKYVSAFHPQGEMLLEDSLKELEKEFPQVFVRVHRNALVNRQHIIGLQKGSAGQVRVRLDGIDRAAVVSRRHLPSLRKLIREL